GFRVLGNRVLEERAVLRRREAAAVGRAERRVDGADPLLGHVIAVEGEAPERGDACAALVEVAEHIGWQDLRFHVLAGTSPEPRGTSSVSTTTRWGGFREPSRRSKASAAASAPMRAASWRMTVVGIASRSASSKSSKPTSAISCSRPRSARSAPTVWRLL